MTSGGAAAANGGAEPADRRPPGRVIVVGAINLDLVVAAPALPGPGETVVGGRVERHGGGKGANAAVAAARAGARVRLIGAVGDDEPGASALDDLRSHEIDASGVAVLAEPTGVALIVVDPAGENQIAVGAGANGAVSGGQVSAALVGGLAAEDCVLVSTEIPPDAVAAAVDGATAAGAQCVLNTAPPIPAIVDLLDRGPVLTPNATELAALAAMLEPGRGDEQRPLADSAREVSSRSGAPLVVTLGAEGVLVLMPDGGSEEISSHPVTVRDTTGAGDTFNGVLAARLAGGAGLGLAVRTATVAASLSVAHVGAREGMPALAAIDAAMQTA